MQKQTLVFEFKGTATEYFKIWMVNTLLTLLTIGFYSPWAKVRTKRYFYSNTFLENSSFDYLADPVKILKGRLLVLAIFILYSIAGIFPVLQGVMTLLLLPIIPWIVIRSLKFNFINSAYRNIRFNFKGEYATACWIYLALPFFVAISVGLAYPYFARERKKFIIDNSRYGTSAFEMSASIGQFYKIFVLPFLVTLGILLSLSAVSYANMSLINNIPEMGQVILLLALYPLLLIALAYIYTATTNLVFNHTRLNQCQLSCHLKTAPLCWIYFSNMLAIIASLGLLIPWAKIRLARYKISCLSLETESVLDMFVADEYEKADAIGEEAGDLLDLDIGL